MTHKTTRKPFPIPVKPATETRPEEDLAASACASGEPYALMVLGDSMLPEFEEGEIIVVEPEGVARDGSFVVAFATIAQRVPALTAGTFSRLAISAAIIAALPTLMVWGISQLVKFFSPKAH